MVPNNSRKIHVVVSSNKPNIIHVWNFRQNLKQVRKLRYVYISESSITTSAAFVLISELFNGLALFTCFELTKYLFWI